MYRLILLGGASLLLAACQQTGATPYHRMSTEELAAYNASVEGPDQIYCIEEVRAGSHIRKRFCASVADINNALINETDTLSVINYGPQNNQVRTPGFFD